MALIQTQPLVYEIEGKEIAYSVDVVPTNLCLGDFIKAIPSSHQGHYYIKSNIGHRETKALVTDKNRAITIAGGSQTTIWIEPSEAKNGSHDDGEIAKDFKEMTSPKKFKELLSKAQITNPDPKVWNRLKRDYMHRIIWAETSDEALELYEHAKNIPCTQTLDIVEHDLCIHLIRSMIAHKKEKTFFKALSSSGKPLMVKFFVDKKSGEIEANVGEKLKEHGIKGFVIPESSAHINRHYVLIMPLHPVCLQEYSRHQRIDNRPISSELLLIFAKQIKTSLDAMHEKLSLYHCDIKPANILISVDSEALICDFGSVTDLGYHLKSSYNLPSDLTQRGACKAIDYILLATTILEMLGCDVVSKTTLQISEYIDEVFNQELKLFLQELIKNFAI